MSAHQSSQRNSRRDSSSHRTHRGLLQVATVTTDFVRSQMPGGRSRGLGVHGRATTATMMAVTAVLMFDAASAHLVVTSPASLVGTAVETATYRNYGPQGATLINAEVVFLEGDAFCKPDPMAVRNKVVMTSRRVCATRAAPYRELAAAGTWGRPFPSLSPPTLQHQPRIASSPSSTSTTVSLPLSTPSSPFAALPRVPASLFYVPVGAAALITVQPWPEAGITMLTTLEFDYDAAAMLALRTIRMEVRRAAPFIFQPQLFTPLSSPLRPRHLSPSTTACPAALSLSLPPSPSLSPVSSPRSPPAECEVRCSIC